VCRGQVDYPADFLVGHSQPAAYFLCDFCTHYVVLLDRILLVAGIGDRFADIVQQSAKARMVEGFLSNAMAVRV